jgi:hypothetical protein
LEAIHTMTFNIRRITPEFLAASLLALALAYLLARSAGLHAHLIAAAAPSDSKGDGGGLEGLKGMIDKLTNAALYATIAAVPLAVIGGGAALAFGSRRGLPIVITALGVLVLIGSVKGIVA